MEKLDKVKKIVVFRPDQIGDIILTTPIYSNLKNTYPDAEIVVVAGYWGESILRNNPHISKIILFNYCFYHRGKKVGLISKFFNILELVLLVRKEKPDLFVDLKGHLKTLLICYMSGAKYRVGKSNGLRGYFLTHMVPYTEDKYEKDNNLDVISVVSEVKNKNLELYPTYGDEAITEKILETIGSEKIVSIFPYAPSPLKRLPAEYYSALVKYLNEQGYTVCFLGGEDSMDFIFDIEFSEAKNVNLAGNLSLMKTYLVVENSKAVVSLDTAGSHLAVAAKVPTLIVYSYSNPKQWSPERENIKIIHKKPDCYPCKVPLDQKSCRSFGKCIADITYEEFFEGVTSILPT